MTGNGDKSTEKFPCFELHRRFGHSNTFIRHGFRRSKGVASFKERRGPVFVFQPCNYFYHNGVAAVVHLPYARSTTPFGVSMSRWKAQNLHSRVSMGGSDLDGAMDSVVFRGFR